MSSSRGKELMGEFSIIPKRISPVVLRKLETKRDTLAKRDEKKKKTERTSAP